MLNILSIGFWAGIKWAMTAMSFCIAFVSLLLAISVFMKISTVVIKAITRAVERSLEDKQE